MFTTSVVGTAIYGKPVTATQKNDFDVKVANAVHRVRKLPVDIAQFRQGAKKVTMHLDVNSAPINKPLKDRSNSVNRIMEIDRI